MGFQPTFIFCYLVVFSYPSMISTLAAPKTGTFGTGLSDGSLESPLPKTLVYLGQTADGKSYFVDRQVRRTWQEAREFCKTHNLKLASVDSKIQTNFLASTRNNSEIQDYWTAARESRETIHWCGLTWEGFGHNPDYDNFYEWYHYRETPASPYTICAYLMTSKEVNGNYGAMLTAYCSDRVGTLCEPVTSEVDNIEPTRMRLEEKIVAADADKSPIQCNCKN